MTALARWLSLDPARRSLLLRAGVALCVAALKVRLVPFPRIAAALGPMQAPRSPQSDAPTSPDEMARAQAIRWAIGAAARRLPFECACLTRALAAHALARKHGLAPTLHMGAETGQRGAAETHAWLTAAGVGVTGFPLPPRVVEIGCFYG
jgi:hypothetical protein